MSGSKDGKKGGIIRPGLILPEPPKGQENGVIRPGLILPEKPEGQENGVIKPPGVIKPESSSSMSPAEPRPSVFLRGKDRGYDMVYVPGSRDKPLRGPAGARPAFGPGSRYDPKASKPPKPKSNKPTVTPMQVVAVVGGVAASVVMRKPKVAMAAVSAVMGSTAVAAADHEDSYDPSKQDLPGQMGVTHAALTRVAREIGMLVANGMSHRNAVALVNESRAKEGLPTWDDMRACKTAFQDVWDDVGAVPCTPGTAKVLEAERKARRTGDTSELDALTQKMMNPGFKDPYSAEVMGVASHATVSADAVSASLPSMPAFAMPSSASTFAMRAASFPSGGELVFGMAPALDTRSSFTRQLEELRSAPTPFEATMRAQAAHIPNAIKWTAAKYGI